MLTSKKIILFANGLPGLEICKYLISTEDEIIRLYVIDFDDDFAKKIIRESKLDSSKIFSAKTIHENSQISELQKLSIDYMITVYWPYLLKPEIFKIAINGCINFHPALLPINRGWYPHVHSILDGSPTGVTLHLIDENADTGPILIQKEVLLEPVDTAKTIYLKLQQEIISLFQNNWEKIKNHEILPQSQDEFKAIYHKKSELDQLDLLDLDKEYKAKDLINLLRSRTFGTTGYAYFLHNGKKVYLNLRLSYNKEFLS